MYVRPMPDGWETTADGQKWLRVCVDGEFVVRGTIPQEICHLSSLGLIHECAVGVGGYAVFRITQRGLDLLR